MAKQIINAAGGGRLDRYRARVWVDKRGDGYPTLAGDTFTRLNKAVEWAEIAFAEIDGAVCWEVIDKAVDKFEPVAAGGNTTYVWSIVPIDGHV